MSKAQIGDLVRIVVNKFFTKGIYNFNAGKIVEIVGFEGGCPMFIDENGTYRILLEDDYEIHRKVGEEDEEISPTKDAINPQHYKQGRVEVIDIIEDAVQGADPFEAVLQANIIKYTQRYRNKNGIEDLNKAQWYLSKLVSYLENK